MDELLPQLLAFPPHPPPAVPISDLEFDKQIRNLNALLTTTPSKLLTTPFNADDQVLTILDPSRNTLPYLHALVAKIAEANNPKEPGTFLRPDTPLWTSILLFFERFDPIQVRYAPDKWKKLVDAVVRCAEVVRDPTIAIPPLRSAILRLEPSGSCFTWLHLRFAHLCLAARAFGDARPVLDHDVFHFPTADRHHDTTLLCAPRLSGALYLAPMGPRPKPQDHLKYFLYGAMVYMALHEWERALLFLEVVVESPVQRNASMIQAEAYKKYILCHLIRYGKPSSAHRPRLPGSIHKQLTALARPYHALGQLFLDDDHARLLAEFNAGLDIWQADLNLPLVLLALAQTRLHALLALRATFSALPLSYLGTRLPPLPSSSSSSLANGGASNGVASGSGNANMTADERLAADTHAYVSHLIATGQIAATLHSAPSSASTSTTTSSHPSETYLRFLPPSASTTELQTLTSIQAAQRGVERLGARIHDFNSRVQLSTTGVEAERQRRKYLNGGKGAREKDEGLGGMGDGGRGVGDRWLAGVGGLGGEGVRDDVFEDL